MSQAPQHAPARRAAQPRVADRLVQSAMAFVRPAANARRVLIEDIREDKKSWAQHGVTALAVSALGLAVAGSVVMTGSAQTHGTITQPQVSVQTAAGVSKPRAFDTTSTSRDAARTPIDPAKIKSMAEQRAEVLAKTDAQIAKSAQSKAVAARDKALASDAAATRKQAEKIAAQGSTAAAVGAGTAAAATGTGSVSTTLSTADSSGKACLPITSGYTIAARFGDVGAWARYHTGLDFAAPVGTPIHAPIAGVVTNAGIGPASGWAGNYVAIRYSDGTQSLMAHMSTVSVSVGQTVSACQVVGAIGMTGRTFGPHVHFEIYPAGVTPGDVYKAINPAPWLQAHGLRP